MKLKITKVQLLLRLHDFLKFSNAQPILITSKPYIEFMENTYGATIPHSPYQA